MDERLIRFLRENAQAYTPQQLRERLVAQGHAPADVDGALAIVFGRPGKAPSPAPGAGEAEPVRPVRVGYSIGTVVIWVLMIPFFLGVLRVAWMLVRPLFVAP